VQHVSALMQEICLVMRQRLDCSRWLMNWMPRLMQGSIRTGRQAGTTEELGRLLVERLKARGLACLKLWFDATA
jgi:hypothetical protein